MCCEATNLSWRFVAAVKTSEEWPNSEINHFRNSCKQQLMSPRKNIYDHKESEAGKASEYANSGISQSQFL